MNFYADWCGFSRSLAPEFESAAASIKNEFDVRRVVFAKIDCEQERKSFAGKIMRFLWFFKGLISF